jgi:hypothetical protein
VTPSARRGRGDVLGDQEQEREGRAAPWTSKNRSGGRATPWASGRGGEPATPWANIGEASRRLPGRASRGRSTSRSRPGVLWSISNIVGVVGKSFSDLFTRLLAQFKTDANISSALAHEACFIELLSLHVCTNSQSIV